MKIRRSSGIILPLYSVPSSHGIGTLGKGAFTFIDFLAKAEQSWWQMLPLGPSGSGDSPYSSYSTFAGNTYLIDPDLLAADGLLTKEEAAAADYALDASHVDYRKAEKEQEVLLRKAFARAEQFAGELRAFEESKKGWVRDYALYMALKKYYNGLAWMEWPDEEIRLHRSGAVERYHKLLAEDVSFYIFGQFLFYRQWDALKAYAKKKEVGIIGDMPIYVAMDSADIWAEPRYFQLDEKNVPRAVAGVPPDYFSEEGQLWGNPLYDWEEMEKDGFGWWIRRVDHAASMFDVLRIDHFRGLESYWAVPYGAKTAKEGQWKKGPGEKFVRILTSWFSNTQFIAEDLGSLTPAVHQLLRATGLPGMKVLQFAFDPVTPSSYLPHWYEPECICYTGTHDNMTLGGWLRDGDPKELKHAAAYLGLNEEEGPVWGVIRGGMSSVARLFMAQMQDYLELGNEARTNVPGVAEGNWNWRLPEGALTEELADKIARMTKLYGRALSVH